MEIGNLFLQHNTTADRQTQRTNCDSKQPITDRDTQHTNLQHQDDGFDSHDDQMALKIDRLRPVIYGTSNTDPENHTQTQDNPTPQEQKKLKNTHRDETTQEGKLFRKCSLTTGAPRKPIATTPHPREQSSEPEHYHSPSWTQKATTQQNECGIHAEGRPGTRERKKGHTAKADEQKRKKARAPIMSPTDWTTLEEIIQRVAQKTALEIKQVPHPIETPKDDGNFGTETEAATLPLYNEMELRRIDEETEAVEFTIDTVAEWYATFIADEQKLAEIDRMIEMGPEIIITASIQQWKYTRNAVFWITIRRLIERGIPPEEIDQLIKQYMQQHTAQPRTILDDTSKMRTKSTIIALIYTTPKLWPTYLEDHDSLTREQLERYGEITGYTRLQGAFLSTEANNIQADFGAEIQAEMQRRWEVLEAQANEFISQRYSESIIISIGIEELISSRLFTYAPFLDPIEITRRETYHIKLVAHEWDPDNVRITRDATTYQQNEKKLQQRKLQLQEYLRVKQLINKVCIGRPEYEQKQPMSEEMITNRVRHISEGQGISNIDINRDIEEEGLADMCLRQWNTDRNYTLLVNLKQRLKEDKITLEQIQNTITVYKEKAKRTTSISQEETIATERQVLTAFLLASPINWPTTSEQERIERRRDPIYNKYVERFGESLVEYATIYNRFPEWDTQTDDPEQEALLRSHIEEKEKEGEHASGRENGEYKLWDFILSAMFMDTEPGPTEIYGQLPPGLTLIPQSRGRRLWQELLPTETQGTARESENTHTPDTGPNEDTTYTASSSSEPDRDRIPGRDFSSSSDTEPEPEPEPEPTLEEQTLEERLRYALMADDIEIVQERLEEIRARHIRKQGRGSSLDQEITSALETRNADEWPKPLYCSCPFEGCEEIHISPGHLRKHMTKRHKLDPTRVRDDVHIILENLINRTITSLAIKTDGEATPTETNGVKAPLKCHVCDYIANRDSIIEQHWEKNHPRQLAEVKRIGFFWAKIRFFLKRYDRMPTLLEMLGERETLRCEYCGDLRNSAENMAQHLRSKHECRDPSKFDIINNTYEIQNMIMDFHEEARDPPGDIRETSTEPEPETPIVAIDPEIIELPDNTAERLMELGISEYGIRRALEAKDRQVFKTMAKIAFQADKTITAAFIQTLRDVKTRPEPLDLTTESDIGDLLWTIRGEEWPQMVLGHWCALCDTYYEDRESYHKHRQTHTTEIDEIAATRDYVRMHAPKTALYAITPSQIVQIERNIKRCETPGCNFCYEDPERYHNHIENMLTNEGHTTYIQEITECGTFYGTIRMLVKKHGHLPTLGEVYGNSQNPINICSTCYEILPKNRDAVLKHYRDKKHSQKKGAWAFAARITEKERGQDNIQTQFEILMQADRRELDKLIDLMEQRLMKEEAQIPETEEDRRRNELVSRIVIRREEERERQRRTTEHAQTETNHSEREEETETAEARIEREEIEPQNMGNPEESPTPTAETSTSENEEEQETPTDTEPEDIQMETRANSNRQRQAREQARIQRLQNIIRARDQITTPPQDEERQKEQRKWAKAKRWREEGQDKEKRGLQIPKMTRDARKQVREGLRDLWKDEIQKLIEEYDPQPGNDEQWLGFEGAIYKMEDLLRTHALLKMGRKPESMYRRKHREFYNKEKETIAKKECKIRRVTHIAQKMERLQEAYDNNKEREAQRIAGKIKTLIEQLSPQERQKWWKTDDLETIISELSNQLDDPESYGNWLESTIATATEKLERRKNRARNPSRVQEEYSDNANRTMRNLIWQEERPECNIPMQTMVEHTKGTMRREEVEEENLENFESNKAIPQESQEDVDKEMIEYMTDIENIMEAISSRQWNSAPGVDGLDYTLYKEGGKEAAIAIQKMLQIIMREKRAPIQFKTSRTVYIYKKGDERIPSNWRPLTISNALYRIIMVLMSRYLLKLNKSHDILEESQKGFIDGVSGTAENILTLTELFNDAQRKHKSIYVAALDFQNAFGSVNHQYMHWVLERKGLPETFRKIVKSIYEASTTRLDMQHTLSESIDIKKGMKQGCPLSPLLFNISIDPLIRKLNARSELGYSVGQDSFTVQAYADDIILISNRAENLNKLIQIVQDFTKISGTKLAPHKCTAYTYAITSDQRRIYSANIKIGDQQMENATKDATIRYLGAPVSARKTDRVNNNKISEAHFVELLQKITSSQLCITQKVHAIKTFLLPKLDYELVTNQIKVHTLQRLDRKIRSLLNKEFGAILPKAVYHASWKDGGLGIPSIEDRQQVSTIRALLCLLTSKHQKVKHLIETALKDERKKRKIEQDTEEGEFMGWKIDREIGLEGTHGTGSLTARACKASLALGITLKEKEKMTGKTLELSGEERTIEIKNQSSANSSLLEIIRKKWQKPLEQPTFHLHSYNSLVNNKESNAFTIRIDNPVKDSFIKFVFKARTNTLPTREFIEIIKGTPHTRCSRCHQETNESLQHILNGCPINRRLIMDRHDEIVRYLRDQIRETRPEYVYSRTDATIREIEIIENRDLKPDIQAWSEARDKALIVEVNVPYAKTWEGKASLEEKYEIKVDKYRDLIRELQARGVETEFYAIVVSSLGALYKESQRAIFQMLHNDKRCRTVCRMISSKAINGSARIWRESFQRELGGTEDHGIEIETANHEPNDSQPSNTDREHDIEEIERETSTTEERQEEEEHAEENYSAYTSDADDELSESEEHADLTEEQLRRLFGEESDQERTPQYGEHTSDEEHPLV